MVTFAAFPLYPREMGHWYPLHRRLCKMLNLPGGFGENKNPLSLLGWTPYSPGWTYYSPGWTYYSPGWTYYSPGWIHYSPVFNPADKINVKAILNDFYQDLWWHQWISSTYLSRNVTSSMEIDLSPSIAIGALDRRR